MAKEKGKGDGFEREGSSKAPTLTSLWQGRRLGRKRAATRWEVVRLEQRNPFFVENEMFFPGGGHKTLNGKIARKR